MTKVLITGPSGAGKTEIAHLLSDRGYAAYDADSTDGLTRLEDRISGQPVQWPEGYVDWSKYAYNLNREKLEEILQKNSDVFISVVASNQKEYFSKFDLIIILHVTDKKEHLRRLRDRNVHEYGQDEKNLLRTTKIAERQVNEWKELGGVILNADQSKETVTDEILRISNLSMHS